MKTQQLAMEHHDALKNILETQKSYFGINVEDFGGELTSPRALNLYLNYLRSDNPYYKCFGCFEGDQLLGTISIDFMQTQPVWVLRRIVVDERIKATPQSLEVIHSLMTRSLEVAEVAGYYQHLYLIPAKYRKAHARIWGENDARKGRYTAVELELVKAGNTSRFRDHWEYLYGRMTFPIDTSVRMSFLNPELR